MKEVANMERSGQKLAALAVGSIAIEAERDFVRTIVGLN